MHLQMNNRPERSLDSEREREINNFRIASATTEKPKTKTKKKTGKWSIFD